MYISIIFYYIYFFYKKIPFSTPTDGLVILNSGPLPESLRILHLRCF